MDLYNFDMNQAADKDIITGAFIISSCTQGVNAFKKPFLNIILTNINGSVPCKLWDSTDEIYREFSNNKIVIIQATVNVWQGTKQLIINKYKFDCDNVDINQLLYSTKLDVNQMDNFIIKTINSFTDPDLQILTDAIYADSHNAFIKNAASRQHHHNYRGGLLEHTYTMLTNATLLVNQYGNNINKDLLFAGCILHDIGKIQEMNADEYGLVEEYTAEGELLGHIAIMLQTLAEYKLKLKYEKNIEIDNNIVTLLSHLILTHHGQPDYGSPKFPMIKEAELLHYLDMVDTKMFMFDNLIDSLEEDKFSNRQWALDNRKVYHHK